MKTLLLSLLLIVCSLLSAQTITFDNPSFEGMPRHSKTPEGWQNCGLANESPPDIQPDLTFGIITKAYAGNTFLGMVTRDNETWESVGTQLSAPLEPGICYSFGIVLARSTQYTSNSRLTNELTNYIAPTRLRIWGGNTFCDRTELLAESPLIHSTRWKTYIFKLTPEQLSCTHLVLEVHYQEHILSATNGNLLLDAASDITVLPDCRLDNYVYQPFSNLSIEKDLLPTTDSASSNAPSEPAVEEQLSTIKLLNPAFFRSEGRVRQALTDYLDELRFDDDHQLTPGAFYLNTPDEPIVIPVNPTVYKMVMALKYSRYSTWELVVYDESLNAEQEKIAQLTKAFRSLAGEVTVQVTPYQDRAHKRARWDCQSRYDDLYLRAVE